MKKSCVNLFNGINYLVMSSNTILTLITVFERKTTLTDNFCVNKLLFVAMRLDRDPGKRRAFSRAKFTPTQPQRLWGFSFFVVTPIIL